MNNKTHVGVGINDIHTRQNYIRNVLKKIGGGVTGLALATTFCVTSPTKAQALDLTNRLTGHVNAQHEVLTGGIDETTSELAASSGYTLLQKDDYSIIAPLIRGKIKDDGKGREHPWNNYNEAAIGIQARYKGILAAGLEAGYRENKYNDEASGNFYRAYAEFWHRFFGPDLTKSKTFPLTPVVQGNGEVSHHSLEKSVLAKLEGQVGLRLIKFDNKYASFALDAPSVRAKISTDSNNRPWNRYSEYAGGAEATLNIGGIPFYSRIEAGNRDSPEGAKGDFVRFVIGIWKGF